MKLFLILAAVSQILTGRVVCDGDGIKGVSVSDGHKVVVTDSRGRYRIKSDMPEGYVFISIPSGYEVPPEGLIPQFFSRERQNALFELRKVDQKSSRVVVFTDLHLTGDKIDNDLSQFHSQFLPEFTRSVSELQGPVYTLCLGDMTTDGKWYKNNFAFPEYLSEMASYPTPVFHVPGNHDNDQRCSGSFEEWESAAEQRYKNEIGPNYYSLNIGGIHFLMLDDIITHGPKAEGNPARNYVGKFGYTYAVDEHQMAWIREDLKRVPLTVPLVVCMHVPLFKDGKKIVANAEELLALFEGRPKVDFFAGHCHTTRVSEIAPGRIEHLIASASTVSWKLNDIQAPLVCDDGTPAGWQVLSIVDGRLGWQFKSAYCPVEKSQCSVYDMGGGDVLINVFNWDPEWKLEAECDCVSVPLERIWADDPTYVKIRKKTKMLPTRPTAFLPYPSPHFFRGHFSGSSTGFKLTLTDRFGNVYHASLGDKPFPKWEFETVVVYTKGECGYDTFRIPAIVRAANGDLLAFAEARKDGAGDTGNIDLVVKRSSDNGATWGQMSIVWDDGDNVCGNPAPVVDKKSGRIIMPMTWNDGRDPEKAIHARTSIDTRRVFVTFSDDDGGNWSTPREITSQAKFDEWTWYATGPCHSVQLPDGRILVPCNHGVYGENGPAGTASHILISDDTGESWRIGAVSEVGNESSLAVLSDGSVMLNMRAWKGPQRLVDGPYRLVSVSSDRGETLSGHWVEKQLTGPACQGSILDAYGFLWFCNPSSTRKRTDMVLRRSVDDGRTWQTKALLPGAHSAYSDLVSMEDGGIGVLYETGQDSCYDTISFTVVR